RRARRITQRLGDIGSAALRLVDIALHFAQRDAALGPASVGMKDGIDGILPALIDEPAIARALIFDEAIAIAVAIPVDPGKRRLDIRPYLRQGLPVVRALEIARGENDKERRAVGRAVIECEGN